MHKRLLGALTAFCLGAMTMMPAASAAEVNVKGPGAGKKIVYIPIDNRPVNDSQTVEVAEKLGYKVLVPPKEMLGGIKDYGHPEELLKWLEENSPGAQAAVVSTDAMLYGSLVGSRKHDLTAEKIMERAEALKTFHENHKRLPLYAFGTIMRTPRGAAYSSEEPAYYKTHGDQIFAYTALLDKEEMQGLSRKDKKQLAQLKAEIPAEYLDDWLQRRARNYDANERFMTMAEAGVFNYFLLGCDDSAVPSQTHRESRHLEELGETLGKTRSVVTSGADELGMLMVSRAIHDNLRDVPFVYAEYAKGKGAETIPTYTNEKIGDSVEKAIAALGGIPVNDPKRADLVLLVSTNPDGKTSEANFPVNTTKFRKGTKDFVKKVNDYVQKGYPVAVADIAYGNGADNALLEGLRKDGLQFRLQGYGGWNTATNSSGFLLGAASLANKMSKDDVADLLFTRYVDDWAYQANVRQQVANMLGGWPGEGGYGKLDAKLEPAREKTAALLKDFLQRNLCFPWGLKVQEVQVDFPWNRMFECDAKVVLKDEDKR
ncbi:DUF4127 family protein [Selenomonas sp. KH1T6]|uniref:DUF4127 family protein n=1 Tax=Selenomonas sp. KH1T6 TaxID=3158784 RepID=UPI0009BDA88F